MGRGIDLKTRKKITVPIYINEIPWFYKWGFLYKEDGVFISKRGLADCPFCAEHIVCSTNDTSHMPDNACEHVFLKWLCVKEAIRY